MVTPNYSKFGLGVQNKAGKRLIEYCQKNTVVIANSFFQQHQRRLHVAITRWPAPKSLIIFFAAKDGEALPVSKNKTRS